MTALAERKHGLSDKTADQVACDAIAMLGQKPMSAAACWGLRAWDSLEQKNTCDFIDIPWQEMTLRPSHEHQRGVSLEENSVVPRDLFLVADETASHVLATRLNLLALTPTFGASKTQQLLLVNSEYDTRVVIYVIAHAPTTTSWDPLSREVVSRFIEFRRSALRRLIDLPASKRSRAFEMFSELREWLNLTTEETAALIGVGRTTPLAWERDGREPQPARARRLYQVHSIVSGLVNRLGAGVATDWLERGSPSPRELLVQGDIDSAATAAERILLLRGPQSELPDRGALIPAEDSAGLVVPLQGVRRRRSARRKGSAGGAA